MLFLILKAMLGLMILRYSLLYIILVIQFPVRFCLVCICRALIPCLFRTPRQLPAWCIIKELFNTFDTDLFVMYKVSQTVDPLQVIIRIKSFVIFSGRPDQTVFLIKPKCLRSDSYQLSYNSYGVVEECFFYLPR